MSPIVVQADSRMACKIFWIFHCIKSCKINPGYSVKPSCISCSTNHLYFDVIYLLLPISFRLSLNGNSPSSCRFARTPTLPSILGHIQHKREHAALNYKEMLIALWSTTEVSWKQATTQQPRVHQPYSFSCFYHCIDWQLLEPSASHKLTAI